MKRITHNVTAQCHKHGVFVVQRNNIRKESTSGKFYTIKNVVCRKCGSWADVLKIEEATA